MPHHASKLGSDHDGKGGTTFGNNLVPLVGQIGDTNLRGGLCGGRSHIWMWVSIESQKAKIE